MGEVIRKSAAAEDILADLSTTLLNAALRGGAWESDANEWIEPVVLLARDVTSRWSAAREASAQFRAATAEANDQADALLGRVYDEIWNEVGRPGSDAFLDLLFPEGSAYYAEGSTEEQPERMELLAELLEAGLHPRLSPESAKAKAAEVRQAAERLRTSLETGRRPRTQAELLSRVRTAVARAAQTKLVALKRVYRARGYSETEIHEVIPDRSRSSAAPAQVGEK